MTDNNKLLTYAVKKLTYKLLCLHETPLAYDDCALGKFVPDQKHIVIFWNRP